MIGGKGVEKSRKSFNQANQGSDNGLGGAYWATVCALQGQGEALQATPLRGVRGCVFCRGVVGVAD